MYAKRIIPCLDIRDGKTVKGVNFKGITSVGDPVEMARRYSEQMADELVFLDISATLEGRKTFASLVERISREINIPFIILQRNLPHFRTAQSAVNFTVSVWCSHRI